MTFAQTLSMRRMWLGWTMAETAAQLDVQVETYRTWENGKHEPHILMQQGIVAELDRRAIARARAILTELSPANLHGCSPSCPHAERGPIDTNTRSESRI